MEQTRQTSGKRVVVGEDCGRCWDETRDCDHCAVAEELRGEWPTVGEERKLDGGIEEPLPMARPTAQGSTVRLTLAEVPFSLNRQPATVAGRRRARGLF